MWLGLALTIVFIVCRVLIHNHYAIDTWTILSYDVIHASDMRGQIIFSLELVTQAIPSMHVCRWLVYMT